MDRPVGTSTQFAWRLFAPLVLLAASVSVFADAAPPNIVLVLADDMGFSDIGSFGGEIDTPNLDKLAADGLRFSSFYNSARCSPTRAALLTGRYPHDVQMGHLAGRRFAEVDGYRGDLDQAARTIPEVLSDHGYRNVMVGKWHLSSATESDLDQPSIAELTNTPARRGFDEFYGTLLGGNNYFEPKYLFRDDEAVSDVPSGFYYTDAIGSEAAAAIERHWSDPDEEAEPLFLYVAFTAPHWPIQAPEASVAKYRSVYRDGWQAVREKRFEALAADNMIVESWVLPGLEDGAPEWDESQRAWRSERMAVHAAMVDHMDRGIGRVLSALRETGQYDNTIVLFLSDNGASAESFPATLSPALRARFEPYLGKYAPAGGAPLVVGNNPDVMPGSATTMQSIGKQWAEASNTPFRRYKGWVHEGGVATPLIVHWPAGMRAAPGSIDHEPGHVVDILPTLLDVIGIRPTDPDLLVDLDGESLLASFAGAARQRGAIYFEHEGHRAVRAGRWKIVAAPGESWALYDMLLDRTETLDLSGKYPSIVRELSAKYEAYATQNKVLPWTTVLENAEVNP
ncbi:MAG: arylsulfatase [Pseudomonadaceae bacterium]|nr:arylsulfatase [Pseudomonadaceae bacterium]